MNIEAITLTPEQVRERVLESLRGIKIEIEKAPTIREKINSLKFAEAKACMGTTSLFLLGHTEEAEKLSIGSYNLIGDMYGLVYPEEVRA